MDHCEHNQDHICLKCAEHFLRDETPEDRHLILRAYGNVVMENPDVTLQMVRDARGKIVGAVVDYPVGV